MTYNNGEVTVRSQEEWMNIMLEAGSDFWSDDIAEDDTTSAIKYLYEPFAGRLSELEQQLQSVLQSLQITEATGDELDTLGERYGIKRNQPERATGEVSVSRNSPAPKDYLIQSGVIVQTDSIEPLQFQTTEEKILPAGGEQVIIPVEAVEVGEDYNVTSGKITQLQNKPNGVQSVTNPAALTGGKDKETDTSYRQRILSTLRNADSASGWNLYKKLTAKSFVRNVKFTDKKSSYPTPNLGDGDFEVTVEAKPGYDDEIAQLIFENSPMGANPVAGYRGESHTGTATLENGQQFDIKYSKPTRKQIHIDAKVETSQAIQTDKIIDNIVDYIGGIKTNESEVSGQLQMGRDVVYGNIDFNIRKLNEVIDVVDLTIGTTSSPTQTSSISIADSEVATTKASDINIITT
jgi:uncharacterized phage protein gp47/JayE